MRVRAHDPGVLVVRRLRQLRRAAQAGRRQDDVDAVLGAAELGGERGHEARAHRRAQVACLGVRVHPLGRDIGGDDVMAGERDHRHRPPGRGGQHLDRAVGGREPALRRVAQERGQSVQAGGAKGSGSTPCAMNQRRTASM
jgi:hypothetical protein